MTAYPRDRWARIAPEDAGFDAEKLSLAKRWLDDNASVRGYRVAIVRDGRLVAQYNAGFSPDERLPIASAAKSVYGNVLGIAVREQRIPSPDAHVVDIYPELMSVPEGTGPKEGRYAFPKDRNLTYRQLISNTSGYMKPGEEPGKVFHYQTFGMNVLTHAIATAYDLYDLDDPEGSPGFADLVREKVADPIGAHWTYTLSNFDLQDHARLPIFGYYCQIHTDPLDLARVGWLWCNWGRWEDRQVIPESWMRESVRVNPDLMANAPRDQHQYGYGIWTNAQGVLWPDLPRDGFTASGAGGHYATVFPTQRLVIVQNPGRYVPGDAASRGNAAFLALVLAALR